MEFYEVLEKRRTVRDFSGREVSDELLRKVLGAAFKAPTNDHLRQFEFVVVRGRENIARLVAPVAGNTSAIQDPYIAKEKGSMDKDEYAMFVDALPKQQRMLLESGCVVRPFSARRTAPCASLPTKVPSITLPLPGLLWKTSSWQPQPKVLPAPSASP